MTRTLGEMDVVCKKWTEDFEVYGYHIKDILSLIKEAYGERAKEGISFVTLNYTIDDFLAECTDADYWFLAFDENRKLCGTARLIVNGLSGEVCNFAVSPQIQGKHIGSQLLQSINILANQLGLDHIISYTAIQAKSSVKCHCNNGFKIVWINISLGRPFSSYVFRNQLSSSFLWNCDLFIKMRYVLSLTLLRVAKRSDGYNTWFGNMIMYFKQKLRNYRL